MATTATVAASAALPHDLIINILTRLPAKALCKFRCVSKQWLNLISDPYFVSLHHTRSRSNPNLLLVRSSPHDATDASNENLTLDITCSQMNSYSDHEFAVTIKESTVHMLPSRWDLVFFAGENAFYVCNPSIQEFFKLPHCSTCTSGEVNAGLGFNSATKEYVLVHLFDRSMDTYEYDIGIEVLRLSECRLGGSDSGSWKVVEGKNCPCQIRGWGVFVGNSFYWMIWDEFEQPGEEAIVYFDLDREEFGVVAAPKGCFDTEEVWFLVELRGFLCLVDSTTRPFTIDIWMMKDCEKVGEWVREYSIDLSGFSIKIVKSIVPLDYRDGEILMDSNRESLEAYNVENKSFRRMSNRIEGNWTWLRLYTDSFFSLGST
ncbi:F-box protein CPR1-like [Vitis riparia]|uniref:F-box protein CPR1-like n=1 Tax=Vitis riparia TaxID=96939 RepID=UPI00155B2D23|nr:F-box protein CPR1-like [Vitis riparia]